jgi:uncharacterized protein YbjT (DUF2867 family)
MDRTIRALVMGATGQVGGAVVNQLKGIASIDVVAAARDVSKAKRLGVPVVRLDLDDIETFAPALIPALVGRQPRLLSDFVSHHADQFRY